MLSQELLEKDAAAHTLPAPAGPITRVPNLLMFRVSVDIQGNRNMGLGG